MNKGAGRRLLVGALTIALGATLMLGAGLMYRSGMLERAQSGPLTPIFRQETVRAWAPLPLVLAAALAAASIRTGRGPRPVDRTPAGPMKPPVRIDESRRAAFRAALYALAALLLALGVGGGGMRDVMAKAIRICTECVGIG